MRANSYFWASSRKKVVEGGRVRGLLPFSWVELKYDKSKKFQMKLFFKIFFHTLIVWWLQRDSKPQPLSSWTNTQPFRSVWLNGWLFVYELSGCGFKSRCSYLNFRHRIFFDQGVPWHSGNYRMWVHSERCTWHRK